jgi:signal transduction histidine kinase
MNRVRTSDVRLAAVPGLRHERAQAVLLPLLTAGVCGLFPRLSWLVVLPVAVLAVLRPRFTARLAPYALFAYGAYGLFFAEWLAQWNNVAVSGGPSFLLRGVIDSQAPVWGVPTFGGPVQTVIYGVLRVGPADNSAYVLPEAFVILAAATWLLAVGDARGSGAVRQALAQLRGAGGQPKTVPPLLLVPVIMLWEELLGRRIWFADSFFANPGGTVWSIVILAAGVALATWRPRIAAAAAVLGTVVLGLVGLVLSLRLAVPSAAGPVSWFTIMGYGPLMLYGRYYGGLLPSDGVHPALADDMLRLAGQEGPLVLSFTAAQGLALLALGGLLALRLPVAAGGAELAEHTQALTQRVTRLTETRRDATETAAAELRRIERDLHDGAQARLVAVGMSLRAAEQLMPANPEAAMALVAEARETSSRALDDLRDLVRGIYPPILADRGLPDALRALALDAPLAVHTEIDLPAEPPMPVAAAAYFAVAEALANAVRHAGAATVGIAVTHADRMLRATVTDDGHGGADPARGTGLAGVERRLATFDGTLAVCSPPGGPTIIAIEIPYASYPPAGGSLADVVRSSWQTKTLI